MYTEKLNTKRGATMRKKRTMNTGEGSATRILCIGISSKRVLGGRKWEKERGEWGDGHDTRVVCMSCRLSAI